MHARGEKKEVSQLESNYDGIIILGNERAQGAQRVIITHPGVSVTKHVKPNQGCTTG